LETALLEPVIAERMVHASRVSPVYSSGDYSYRNTRMAGDRWLMAGDAAGFIDPIFSTGVFMALLSGEQAADAIQIAFAAPRRGFHRFRGYERNLHQVMDRYLRFVTAWYSPQFIEVFVRPETRFKIPQAINSMLAGNLGNSWAVRWRLELFYLILGIQKYVPICPRLDLTPLEKS
jgi:2-polyprenyl-6-methoxyphenol hydroxylase-like FAD-dependent oxidoreductase